MAPTDHAESRAGSGAGALARAHALLGVVPLAGFLVYHLWQQWPAQHSAELWVDRARATSSLVAAIVLVLVPLMLHAGLGLARMLRGPAVAIPGPNGAQVMRRLQAASGIVGLGFVLYHVVQVFAWDRGPHYGPRDAYTTLWLSLGRPLDLTVYVVGIAALCFHLAHGLPRAAVTLSLIHGESAFRRARYVAGALALGLWLGYLQVVAHVAIGQGLWPRAVPPIGEPAPHD